MISPPPVIFCVAICRRGVGGQLPGDVGIAPGAGEAAVRVPVPEPGGPVLAGAIYRRLGALPQGVVGRPGTTARSPVPSPVLVALVLVGMAAALLADLLPAGVADQVGDSAAAALAV